MSLGLFRMMAALAREMIVANTFGSAALFIIFMLGGFIIPKGTRKQTLWLNLSSDKVIWLLTPLLVVHDADASL